jgi:hypothetical protein
MFMDFHEMSAHERSCVELLILRAYEITHVSMRSFERSRRDNSYERSYERSYEVSHLERHNFRIFPTFQQIPHVLIFRGILHVYVWGIFAIICHNVTRFIPKFRKSGKFREIPENVGHMSTHTRCLHERAHLPYCLRI